MPHVPAYPHLIGWCPFPEIHASIVSLLRNFPALPDCLFSLPLSSPQGGIPALQYSTVHCVQCCRRTQCALPGTGALHHNRNGSLPSLPSKTGSWILHYIRFLHHHSSHDTRLPSNKQPAGPPRTHGRVPSIASRHSYDSPEYNLPLLDRSVGLNSVQPGQLSGFSISVTVSSACRGCSWLVAVLRYEPPSSSSTKPAEREGIFFW